MTRKELERGIDHVIRTDFPASIKVDDIMKLVDDYTGVTRIKTGVMTPVFTIRSNNNCKFPVCPYCGSTRYTIVSCSNGNHRCDECGKVYFFNYMNQNT